MLTDDPAHSSYMTLIKGAHRSNTILGSGNMATKTDKFLFSWRDEGIKWAAGTEWLGASAGWVVGRASLRTQQLRPARYEDNSGEKESGNTDTSVQEAQGRDETGSLPYLTELLAQSSTASLLEQEL